MGQAIFAEFFAGIGLVREAIEPLGWHCAFANDIAPNKAEMYAARFGSDHLAVADIATLEARDLPSGVDLITASFPCIDLSLAGNRAGLAGKHSGTVWPFLRLLEDYCRAAGRPRALLLENVTGFLSSGGGNDLAAVCTHVAAAGYMIDLAVVDARWFVPQSRPRLFVLALSNDDTSSCMMPPPTGHITRVRPLAVRRFQAAHGDLPFAELPLPEPPLQTPTTLADALEELAPDDERWWSERQADTLLLNMAVRHQRRVEELRQGFRDGVATMYRRRRGGKTVGEVRDDSIGGCLRTPQGGSSVQFLIDCRSGSPRIRPLTGREYATLQGVGDFPIRVPERQARLGFGDAVCVPVVRWLVDHAFGHIVSDEQVSEKVQLHIQGLAAA